MKTLKVKTKSRSYPIFIGNNVLKKFSFFQNKFLKNTKNILVVTNKNIPSKYFNEIKRGLKKEISITKLVLPDGEKTKNNKYLNQITNLLSEKNFGRQDCLVALGGGVIGDLTGFAASIFKRGINFVQIPTTLLSQVDSSVGGKTGINNDYGKNLIGCFYQPNFVLIDSNTLKSLPQREMIAGFAEVLKYSLILNKKFFNWLFLNGKNILRLKNNNVIEKAIYESCRFKSYVVRKDEKEENLRAILNFGHTFGHAVETVNGYSKKIIHGEAVLIGMMVAARLSQKLGYLSNADLDQIKKIYKTLNLNSSYKKFVNSKNVSKAFKIMNNDKKSDGKKIKIILLKKIGVSIIKETTLNKTFIPLIHKDLRNGIY